MIPDSIGWARPEDVGMSRERLQRISDFIDGEIGAGSLPGAVTLVARRGRVVHFKAQGRRDPSADDPMALDTIFRIYSMTKPIVSAAAAMLMEEGRIGLADPLADYIPAFAETRVANLVEGRLELVPPRRPITVHDLFRHTSGLTYEWLDEGPVGRLYEQAGAGSRHRSNAEMAATIAGLPLLNHPGTSWDYSRSTDVLGRVIEVVTGRSLGEFLGESLFRPLGMLETGFLVPGPLAGRIAEPFAEDPDSGEAVKLLDLAQPRAFESGGGGLASTAGDYARFVHTIASGGVLDGVRILSPATLSFMMSDHLGPDVAIPPDLLPPGYGFGLGFAVRRQQGLAPFPGSVGDAYWEGLAGTTFWIDPAEQLYAILMVQAPGRRDRYRRLLRQLVYGALTS